MSNKRDRYTDAEECQMISFIATELRSKNPQAKRKGPKIWLSYVQRFQTLKTAAGLESHFRKMMLTRLPDYVNDVDAKDIFLLLRVFKIRLTTSQRNKLKVKLNCQVKEAGGYFRGAVFNNDENQTLHPSEEEIFEIMKSDISSDSDAEEAQSNTNTTNNRTISTGRGRDKYTALEERKMIMFIASELRANNPLARRKSPKAWLSYVKNHDTQKTPSGLESHFRKMMIPKLTEFCREVSPDDLFLLLRIFKVQLTSAQLKKLSQKLDCEVRESREGHFRCAVFNNDDTRTMHPTDEEVTRITAEDYLEDDSDFADIENNDVNHTTQNVTRFATDTNVSVVIQQIKGTPKNLANLRRSERIQSRNTAVNEQQHSQLKILRNSRPDRQNLTTTEDSARNMLDITTVSSTSVANKSTNIVITTSAADTTTVSTSTAVADVSPTASIAQVMADTNPAITEISTEPIVNAVVVSTTSACSGSAIEDVTESVTNRRDVECSQSPARSGIGVSELAASAGRFLQVPPLATSTPLLQRKLKKKEKELSVDKPTRTSPREHCGHGDVAVNSVRTSLRNELLSVVNGPEQQGSETEPKTSDNKKQHRKDELLIRNRLSNILSTDTMYGLSNKSKDIMDVFAGTFIESDRELLEGSIRGLRWLLS